MWGEIDEGRYRREYLVPVIHCAEQDREVHRKVSSSIHYCLILQYILPMLPIYVIVWIYETGVTTAMN